MSLIFERAVGEALKRHIPELAALRMTVFREWPYLYDGEAEYEAGYLSVYADSPSALAVLVRDGERVVGAVTALPLADEPDTMSAPLREAGYAPESTLYLGEFVLYPEYRGQGAGARLFRFCEEHARALGMKRLALSRVVRAADDPRRPVGARENDGFWTRLGCVFHPELCATLDWKEVGGEVAVPHAMEFWIKELAPEASGA